MNKAINIPYAKVDCAGNELSYVEEVLKSGWLTTGAKTALLEKKVKDFLGCQHALAVNSCTSALHLALDAANVKAGDKVFVPSLTFTASAEVIRYMGADPVVLDVDENTNGLNAAIIAKAISDFPDVKAIILVHFGGLGLPLAPSQSDGILEICKNNNIVIIEDAAHALPTKIDNTLVGNFGDITCFSFYANKTMTTGEGGMVVTNSDDIAKRIKLMRLHGIDRDVWNRYTTSGASWEYDVVAPGFKYNMPDINAAVGLAQFERLEEMHAERVRCAQRYFANLSDYPEIILPSKPNQISDHSWHLFPIRIADTQRFSRNDTIEKLSELGIGTSVHYKPIHQLSYYKERYNLSAADFPNAEQVWQSTISLPIYNLLTDSEIDYICDSVKNVVK